ncbi:gluconokinase [Pleurocapsa sp. CCALA 161]|uniref:gluconokinase n=1 Tax=Pleurocapsa sp. CCALA 161 TaxID=2107688 RepID=UPI0018EBCE7C|nr:gluconokinase [Pleurocapsa sp. CCALA 161]
MFYVIMGVSGTGKSTIGRLLSDRLGWDFYDADDFHSPTNLDKMNRGIALTDSDRLPWLKELQQLISHTLGSKQNGILACSALKLQYRQILRGESSEVVFIYLKGDYDRVQSRMKQRTGHFMSPNLLRNQFDTLEEPQDAIAIDIALDPEAIVEEILTRIANQAYSS